MLAIVIRAATPAAAAPATRTAGISRPGGM
jgi:hypothetical protein